MSWLMDMNYVTRVMLKRPGFTVFTLLIMACGLGLCIYMYSLINTLAFKPLPFEDGKRMVMISPSINDVRLGDSPLNYLDYQAIKIKSQTLEDIGFYYGDVLNVNIDGKAIRYVAIRAKENFFNFTDTTPSFGRLFNNLDIIEGANPVAIIGHELWQTSLGGRTDILGQTLLINGVQTEVIGVMPEKYEFPMNNQIWLPSQIDESQVTEQNSPEIFAFAKLVPGSTLEDADIELKRIMRQQALIYPELNNGRSAFVITFMDSFVGEDSKPIFVVMLAGVFFVLLLACCNVGNLLLARASERSKESAIRRAHGAPTFRLIFQMMMESTLICVLGGILGILLAGWGLSLTNHLISSMVPDKPPFWWQLGLDLPIILKAAALILVVSLLTGSLPAWKMTHSNITEVLRDGTRGAQSRRGGKISRALVIFEVLLSCVVLSLGALLTSIVYEAKQIDYGIDTTNVYTSKVSFPDHYDQQALVSFYRSLQNGIEVDSTSIKSGIMTKLPGEFTLTKKLLLEGQTAIKEEQNLLPRANSIGVLPGTLSLLNVRLEQGTFLSDSDDLNSRKVVVITRSFAERYWPGQDNVIGKKLRWSDSDQWFTVTGVVSHVIQGRPFGHSKHMPSVYHSLLQQPKPHVSIVTYNPNKTNMRFEIEQAVSDLDNGLSVYQPKTLANLVERNTAGLTYIAIIFNIFGFTAVLLAGSGIYGVMAKTIEQRSQEIGIRRAMGATEGDIIQMLLKQGGIQLIIGLVLSGPIVFIASPMILRVIGNSAISPHFIFSVISIGITIVVGLATLIPALRAIKKNPIAALREQ
ncbi:ABC transporter permease [Vibrio splendidus]